MVKNTIYTYRHTREKMWQGQKGRWRKKEKREERREREEERVMGEIILRNWLTQLSGLTICGVSQ